MTAIQIWFHPFATSEANMLQVMLLLILSMTSGYFLLLQTPNHGKLALVHRGHRVVITIAGLQLQTDSAVRV